MARRAEGEARDAEGEAVTEKQNLGDLFMNLRQSQKENRFGWYTRDIRWNDIRIMRLAQRPQGKEAKDGETGNP